MQADARSITVSLGKSGEEHETYNITDKTVVTIDGAPANARDLLAGHDGARGNGSRPLQPRRSTRPIRPIAPARNEPAEPAPLLRSDRREKVRVPGDDPGAVRLLAENRQRITRQNRHRSIGWGDSYFEPIAHPR